MTIMIELDPPRLTALQEEAAARGVSVEQLANDILARFVRDRATAGSGEAFRKALADSTRENEELLRRLAK